ncbi:hypothetical protein ATO10_02995 [Actibacterium atlanticum]|uniref:DUF502 domain-containing protein n=1 Tax=Actibacterium atlanticum TaxID=1461693 RepID=A0A058ZQ65_9RHOB|nr:DUF502 domain-containing protein [Actibacterium atlanticum]KCV83693.1 hypothetical protein ATO10_02995 [Actibacterium atlanticum]
MFEKDESDEQRHRAPLIARLVGRFLGWLRSSFLTGLVVIAPIGVTVWLFWTLIGWVDSFVLPFVPDIYKPEEVINRLLGYTNPEDRITVNIRGVGVVFFLLFTLIIGWLMKGFIGRSFLVWAERQVDRMPVVRSVYNGLKQIAETVLAQTETSFDQACLVQYPRKGIWAVAFISTTTKGEIDRKIPRDEPLISVFLPTTPNPTSGFLLFVPREDVVILDMSTEDAAKLVISAGLVYPPDQNGHIPPTLTPPAQ